MQSSKQRMTTEPQITEVSVTVSKTIQVTRFEPVQVSVSQTASVGDGEEPREVRAALYRNTSKAVKAMMKREIADWTPERDDGGEEDDEE